MNRCLKSFVVTAAVFASQLSYAAGGSYGSNATGATIYSPNVWYSTNFPVLGNPPSASRVNPSVSWSYSIGTIPSGGTFIAYLCHGSINTCYNVTNIRTGQTNAFNTDGVSASAGFFLYYKINRSTAFAPVYGGSDQVIVNWE
jgi:flagellar protein FlhE